MNCSQKLISLIFGTTRQCWQCEASKLWIALKSWYLWYSEQRIGKLRHGYQCCELLSKVDIFDIRNNIRRLTWKVVLVVNCSQKLISLIFGTTYKHCPHYSYCCELLSKVDIFDIRNNLSKDMSIAGIVVNCSQKLISLIFGTTRW